MRKSLNRQVRKAYSQDVLARICTLPEREFGRAFGMETVMVEEPGYRSYLRRELPPEDYYHFRDNGSSVLAVAHLDTVTQGNGRVPRFRNTRGGPMVTSGALDDRLGAYVILDLLPKMGITTDLLFTVGEESGASTAKHFEAPRDYDWVIEFDRGGTDVVMYQYECRAGREAIEAAGSTMGMGSFSDIAFLEHLGVKAFNWGVAYRGDYHSPQGYAYLDETFGMVAKYLRFHDQNTGIAMPHEEEGWRSRYCMEDDRGACETCGANDSVDLDTMYCKYCGICQDCGSVNPDIAAEWGNPEDVSVCMCWVPQMSKS